MKHRLTAFWQTRLARAFRKQEGAEVTELAIVLALIVAGAIITIGLIGTKVSQYYVTTEANL
ncbi:MAG: hypothetical protein KDA42_14290 [Planctomycetales bacterium]|nr:hypothetical protein [Planctomycetales bacterium]